MKNINHAPHRVDFWRPLNDACRVRGTGNYGNEPGNAVEVVSKIIQLAKGVGIGEGKEIPLRVPFGSDCLKALKEKIAHLNGVLEEWEDVARSTDFESHAGPMPALPTSDKVEESS
jgi:hypothetical protein